MAAKISHGEPPLGLKARARGPSKHTDGLTLVELLVAISIIATLVGLITVAAFGAAAKARQAACASNLRQIAVAVRMYAEDHDGVPPVDSTYAMGDEQLEPGWVIDSIEPYGAKGAVWFCPSDPDRGKVGICRDHVQHWLTSYVYGGWARFWSDLKYENHPPPDIVSPDGWVLAHCYALAWDARCFDRKARRSDTHGPESWHSGGFNVAYIDGHVRWVRIAPGKPVVKIPNPFFREENKDH